MLLAGFLGAGFAATWAFLLAEKEYQSSALLLPTQTMPNTDQLGAAAALLGKKTGASGDVDLYQSLLTSRTVLRRLLKAPLANESDTGKGRLEPLESILGLDTTMPGEVDLAIKDLSRAILVGTRESGLGGILEIRFIANAPWLARSLGDKVLEIGQEELRTVRDRRFLVTGSQLAKAVEESRREWDSAATLATAFLTANRSIVSPEQRLQLSRLQIDQTAKEQKYLLARRELEVQNLERAKATPPMMILDPASLPVFRIKPKRVISVLAGGILGGIVGILWAIGSTALHQSGIFDELKARLRSAT